MMNERCLFSRSVVRVASAVAWLAVACGALAQPPAQGPWRDVPRVVVVGDVHGAYDALVELLQTTGVLGADLAWSGGATHVVSLGDLLDRGPGVRRVLDLVMRLQGEAAAAGGRLHVILGNHELMNLLGDWRYVAAADYAAFAAEEPAAAREAAYATFAAASAAGDAPATRAEFDRAYPLGYFARQAAFAPAGRYGAWLLSLPAIVIVDGTAYVHGGVPAAVAEQGLGLNAKLRADLERYLALRAELAAQGLLPSADRQHDVETARAALATAAPEIVPRLEEFVALGDARELGLDGPLWYRGSVYCKPLLELPTLDAGLAKLGVRRAIVGHTPTADRRVHALYDGKLVAADTGMLVEYFRGRPAALVLENDTLDVRYLGPPQRAGVEVDGSAVAYGRTDAQLRAMLERGAVATVERGEGALPWRVVLQHEGAAVEAAFYPRGRERAGDLELAAAALDDLLGTALVAPTVARTIEGEEGALQLRYPGSVSEADRVARQLPISGWCPIEPQLKLMYTFDVLTLNRGRTPANVLFANDFTDLTLTAHGQAFGTERTLPAGFDPGTLAIPPALAAKLRSLDEAGLGAALGAWLDTRRIRALLARRDELLAEPRPR
jgi:hypothetical protein